MNMEDYIKYIQDLQMNYQDSYSPEQMDTVMVQSNIYAEALQIALMALQRYASAETKTVTGRDSQFIYRDEKERQVAVNALAKIKSLLGA